MQPPAPAAAPPILLEILDVLYQNSEILLNLFTTLTATFIAYHLGRRAAKKDKEQLIQEIHKVLSNNQNQLVRQLELNKKLRSKLRWNVPWIMLGLLGGKQKYKWEIRLTIYTQKTKTLLDSDKAAYEIYNILMEVTPLPFSREEKTDENN